MMLNVFPDDLSRHFVSHRSGEVAFFPELTALQLSLDLWVLLEDGSRTQALKACHHWGNGQTWWKGTKDMHAVWTHFHFFDNDVTGFSNLLQQLLHPLSNYTLQDLLAVLRCPDEMILRVINCMRCSLQGHTAIVTTTNGLG